MNRTVLRSFHLGVDLGQKKNHTALVIVEQRIEYTGTVRPTDFEPVCERRLGILTIERVPLNTRYGKVMPWLAKVSKSSLFGPKDVVTTVFDATGSEGWVKESVRRSKFRGRTYPVVLTGGLRGKQEDGTWTLPRTELLLHVPLAFESHGLEIGKGCREGAKLLKEECMGMKRVPGQNGWKFVTEGKQDDLVFALGLALWGAAEHPLPVEGERVRKLVMAMWGR